LQRQDAIDVVPRGSVNSHHINSRAAAGINQRDNGNLDAPACRV